MKEKLAIDSMNRYELLNEVDRLKQECERYKKLAETTTWYQNQLHEKDIEIGRLHAQQVIVAQYFDHLGKQPGFEMWLDVADDLRRGTLVGPKKFVRQSQRTVKDRRTQPQGRRKKTRRG